MTFARCTLMFLAFLVLEIQAFSTLAATRTTKQQSSSCKSLITLSAVEDENHIPFIKQMRYAFAATTLGLSLMSAPAMSLADGSTKEFKLPPIDREDKNRCVLQGSSMGQANAARDKLYDLRLCQLGGQDASGLDLSGVIMSRTDVSKAKFVEAYFSKGYLHDSNFDGADFTNAIVDRASFSGSTLRGTIFKNSVLTGTSFENANVEGADFTEAALGDFDIKSLCRNPTLKGENPTTGEDTRMSVGCRN
ncbi:hypothetical protein MPSEU_000469400 [Mayamaea pseudoterrestris]|nr:hypothetical protein MPSEU_000469400 [Mayamaea pseudoterrestris]